jgi:hypothetical protein
MADSRLWRLPQPRNRLIDVISGKKLQFDFSLEDIDTVRNGLKGHELDLVNREILLRCRISELEWSYDHLDSLFHAAKEYIDVLKTRLFPEPSGYEAGSAPCPQCGKRVEVKLVDGKWQFASHKISLGYGYEPSYCPVESREEL